MDKFIKKLKEILPPILLIAVIIIIWEIASTLLQVPDFLLPKPSRIVQAIIVRYQSLWTNLLVTLKEVLLGMVAGFIGGFLLALIMFFSPLMRRTLNPIVVISQTIPVIALGPILVIWLGYNILPKIIVVALIVFFPITVNTFDGLESCDQDLITLLKSMGANRWQIFTKVQLPNAMPFVTSASKVAITFSVIGAVTAEWIGSDKGLGAYILQANARLRTPEMFAAILITSLMGIILFFIAQWAENLIIPWQKGRKIKN